MSCLVILTKIARFVRRKKDNKLSKLFGSQELRVWDGFQLLPFVDRSEPPLGKGPQKDSYPDFSPEGLAVSKIITVTREGLLEQPMSKMCSPIL